MFKTETPITKNTNKNIIKNDNFNLQKNQQLPLVICKRKNKRSKSFLLFLRSKKYKRYI